MTNGTWTHVAGAINVATTTITMWLDGSVADTKSDSLLTNILMHSYDLHLGAKFDDTAQGSFDGYIDEVRISKIARTSDWIETTVVNQQAATPGGGGYLDPIGIECPTDWIAVPGNTTYGTTDFCVMKYEARLEYDGSIVPDGNVNNDAQYDWAVQYGGPTDGLFRAVSAAEGQPWVYIRRGENGAATGAGAIEACQALGAGYDLLTNAEWQTIARDIEAQQSGPTNNWVVDGSSDTTLNSGHTDNSPAQSCDSGRELVDTDCLDSGGESDPSELRTHHLSNGELIWDVAGNAWEWVKAPVSVAK
jgi:hypothetical protein